MAWKSALLVLSLLVLSFELRLAPTIGSDGLTIKNVSFPSDAVTIGMVYSTKDGFVYAASYTYGVIYQVNMTSLTYSTIQLSTGFYNRLYYGLAVDDNGNLWATRRDVGNDGTARGLSKITLPTGTEAFVIRGIQAYLNDTGEWDGVGFCNGFVYTAADRTLYKVNPSTNAVSSTPIPKSGAFYGFSCDLYGNLWFTDIVNGLLYYFNTGTASLSYVTGLHRPLGVATYFHSVFVAENERSVDSGTPAIVTYDMQTKTLSRNYNLKGTPYAISIVMLNGSPYLLYTSSAEDAARTSGIGVVGNSFIPLPEAAIYGVASDPDANVYFSYYGSAGVGSISDWPSGNPIAAARNLTTGVDSGSGSVSPSCPSPSGCSEPVGFQVTATATPSSGWQFSSWSTQNGISCASNPCSFNMPSNAVVLKAAFAQISVSMDDVLVWRGTGTQTIPWFILHPDRTSWTIGWGNRGDTPLLGRISSTTDYDLIVFRNGEWYILTASSGYDSVKARLISWGTSGDKPFVDGNGDLIIFRNGGWFILTASSNYDPSQARVIGWGTTGDIPLMDAAGDLIIFRSGGWFILKASSGYNSAQAELKGWGTAGDIPLVNGVGDLIIFRNGGWFILTASSAYTSSVLYGFGKPGDTPLAPN